MTIKLFYNNGKVFSDKNFRVFTDQSIKYLPSTPSFDTTLTISSGSSVSGNGVTLSGTNGSSISFNQVQSINNPLNITDIRIYMNSLYTYRITTYAEVVSANGAFSLTTNLGYSYSSAFGSGTDSGSYRRIDF
jgi:hypothetical protein